MTVLPLYLFLHQRHHSQLVIENCDKAIALDRRYVKALLRRFKMHQALGHLEEALLGTCFTIVLLRR